ncbi:hypothetical protein EDD21DRAFT_426832 [Dissophora ornata]|nr:hypothetical protein EDD21DRAFT_426832 [Dissophora ornata]
MKISRKTISNIVLWTTLLSVVAVQGVHGAEAPSSAVTEPPKEPEQRRFNPQEQQQAALIAASLDSTVVGAVLGGGIHLGGDSQNLGSKGDSPLNEKTIFIKVSAGIPLPPGPRSA